MIALFVWLLTVPGVRPFVHSHESESKDPRIAQDLELHLRSFSHAPDTTLDTVHLHWLVELDGSIGRVIKGSWPDQVAMKRVQAASEFEWHLPQGDCNRLFMIDSRLCLSQKTHPIQLDSCDCPLEGVHATTLYCAAYL